VFFESRGAVNTRVVQRTLFRMQLDSVFAAAVLRGDADAVSGLGAAERRLLQGADQAGLAADRGGRRRAQVVGNAGSEHLLTLAEADRRGLALDLLIEFPRSAAFHAAIATEGALALAFGDWLAGRLADNPGILRPLAAFERAMAAARRAPREAPTPKDGDIVLGERAHLVDLPEGLFDHAQALRAEIDADRTPPAPSQALETRSAAWTNGRDGGGSGARETVLIVASATPQRHGLRSVAAERLEPAVAKLLRAAQAPLGAAELGALAAAYGWHPDDVAGFVDELGDEGVLVRRD
jgi:hypothetical protein